MLYACIKRFDVTKNLKIFLKLNKAKTWTDIKARKMRWDHACIDFFFLPRKLNKAFVMHKAILNHSQIRNSIGYKNILNHNLQMLS